MTSAPVLTDDRVTLRGLRPEDVPAVTALCQDPEVTRWTTIPVPYSEADARDFVEAAQKGWTDDSWWVLAIEARDPGTGLVRYAGTLDLRPDGQGGAEIGYSLAAWARGRGVMSTAVRLACAWAFAERDVQVVRWQAHVGNWASRRVAWAAGFTVEGTVRAACSSRGRRYDAWVGTLLAGDPQTPGTRWLVAPVVEGRRVRLRPWRADDAPRVAEACSDARSQEWLPGLPSPYTLADGGWYVGSREEEHAEGRAVCWCVASAEDDLCLASVSLMRLADGAPGEVPSGEVGYWSHPDARGRGLLTEGVRLAVRHALLPIEAGGLGLERVTLRAAEGNRGSQRVAEKAGFTLTGRHRMAERTRSGVVQDFLAYDLLASEVAAPADERA